MQQEERLSEVSNALLLPLDNTGRARSSLCGSKPSGDHRPYLGM